MAEMALQATCDDAPIRAEPFGRTDGYSSIDAIGAAAPRLENRYSVNVGRVTVGSEGLPLSPLTQRNIRVMVVWCDVVEKRKGKEEYGRRS